MKKIPFFLVAMAAMTMSMVSCQKDELEGGDDMSNLEQLSFVDTQSKVFLDPDSYALLWKKNDNVRMYTNNAADGSKLYRCPLTGENTATNVKHVVDSADAPAFTKQQQKYAFYPEFSVSPVMNGCSYSTANGDPVFVVDLPNQQVLDNDVNDINRPHLTRFPRAAKCAAGYSTYSYKNLCGIFVLWLSGEDGIDGAVSEITFEANEPSNGNFKISWTGSKNSWTPVLTPVEGYTDDNKVTKLVYHQPIDISNGYQQFFFSLPEPLTPGTGDYEGYHVYTNCKITVTSSTNHIKVLTYDEIPIIRSQMTLLNRDVTNVDEFVKKSGIFTVAQSSYGNPTKKIYFSPGNLQYKNTNWQFAAQQYEVLHGYAGSSYTTDTATNFNQDLFGWSTTNSKYGQSLNSSDYEDGSLASPFKEWGEKAFGKGSPWYTMPVEEWEVLLYKRATNFTYNGTTVRWVATTMGYTETVEHNVTYSTEDYWENNIRHIYNPNIENDFESGVIVHSPDYSENVIYFKNPYKKVGYTSTEYVYEQDGILIFPDDFTLDKWNAATNRASIPSNAINNIGNHPDQNGNNMDMVVLSKQQLKALEEYGVAWLPAVGKAALGGTIGNYSAPGNGQEGSLYYWTATPYEWMRNANGITNTAGNTGSAFQIYVHNNGGSYGMNGQSRTDRCAVRLVREAPRSDW